MKRMLKMLYLILVITGVLVSCSSTEEIRLSNLLTSNMVLQRDGETAIWGKASAGRKVTVQFRDAEYTTKAGENGNWKVMIRTGDAGGPFEMRIKGKKEILLENILVGDVWLCSGQSNMEWPLVNTLDAENEISAADFPSIRLFQVENNAQALPVDEVPPAEWKLCSPETAPAFSAIAYYFGKMIHQETGIPIGLISSNWGGTIVETWTSKEAMADDEIIQQWMSGLKDYDAEKEIEKQKKIYNDYKAVLDEVQQPGYTHPYIDPAFDDSGWTVMPVASLWEVFEGWEVFDGIAWLRKKINLPADFQTDRAVLSLAKIDDSDVVWINGKRIGETYNLYNVNRTYPVPPGVLVSGENTLVIRVEDYVGGGGFHGELSDLNLGDGKQTVRLLADWKMVQDSLPVPLSPTNPGATGLQPNQYPTLLFNGMIHPLLNYAIKGAIWYQGESNADYLKQALRYEMQIKRMITDWRANWSVGDFSFYQVQLANFRDVTPTPVDQVWPYLRETQMKATLLPGVEMACIIDIGEAGDIHPRNKKEVGRRLALKALKADYGKDLVANGPRFARFETEGNQARIYFDASGSSLRTSDGGATVAGFTLAGPDKVFRKALARLEGDGSVKVWCPGVKKIESIRFLWADNPGNVNLYNTEGLPAEPFRTDDWIY
ncbi:MAG TPA: sialate O-acetylesterase [Prolixibacteraceae bacterium]|nr:sialate O-acetylesterase [Prolixibacteraceae bacterium]